MTRHGAGDQGPDLPGNAVRGLETASAVILGRSVRITAVTGIGGVGKSAFALLLLPGRRAGRVLNVRGSLRGKTVFDGADSGLSPLACARVLPGQGPYLGSGTRAA